MVTFVVGLFVGAMAGVFLAAIAIAAGDDDHAER